MKRLLPFAFGRRKDELQEEIDNHLRMAIADRVAMGESETVARQEALREFGNVPLIQNVTRRMWGFEWLEHLAQDLGYAWRQMHSAPMFAFTVIGTLALGIAASAAKFPVVDHILLQPVPYRHPDRIVAILEGTEKEGSGSSLAPWLDIQEWRNRSHSFQQIAFCGHLDGRNYLEEKTSALPIDALQVSPNLFPTPGVNPMLGQRFLPVSANIGSGANSRTIILSYPLWRRVYGSDLGISGRVVAINNTTYTVIGVMPRGFSFPRSMATPRRCGYLQNWGNPIRHVRLTHGVRSHWTTAQRIDAQICAIGDERNPGVDCASIYQSAEPGGTQHGDVAAL